MKLIKIEVVFESYEINEWLEEEEERGLGHETHNHLFRN